MSSSVSSVNQVSVDRWMEFRRHCLRDGEMARESMEDRESARCKEFREGVSCFAFVGPKCRPSSCGF